MKRGDCGVGGVINCDLGGAWVDASYRERVREIPGEDWSWG